MFFRRRTILDRINEVGILFEDVETEGKKLGYEKAAKEYTEAFQTIKENYESIKKIVDNEMMSKGMMIDQLSVRLAKLREKREQLQAEVNHQERRVSKHYNIPITEVKKASTAFGSLTGNAGYGSAFLTLDLISDYKLKKKIEAERRGYQEAKEEYEKKIKAMKENCEKLKKKGEAEIRELTSLIEAEWNDIIEEETRIVELKIVLS